MRIPFFAKAFAAWHKLNHSQGRDTPIFDIVVDQYLAREAGKLKDPHQDELLKHGELKSLFAEIAEMMHLAGAREVDAMDLSLCAQQVLGAGDLEGARPGLSRRLSSLCGFNVDISGTSANRFRFSHEVMFDCFLALALCQKVSADVERNFFFRFFTRGKIQARVFNWFVQMVPEHSARRLLELLSARPDNSPIYAENVGSLWVSLLDKLGGIPPSSRAARMALGYVRLSDHGWSNLSFTGCSLKELVLPMAVGRKVLLDDCDIELLQSAGEERLASILEVGDHGVRIKSMLLDTFEDRPLQIRGCLERLGLIRPQGRREDESLSWREIAKFFLDKLVSRPDVQVIVLASSHCPEDDDSRLKWIKRAGEEQWAQFWTALVETGLARWESISAGGSAKLRLVFNVPVATIADAALSDQRIEEFWSWC